MNVTYNLQDLKGAFYLVPASVVHQVKYWNALAQDAIVERVMDSGVYVERGEGEVDRLFYYEHAAGQNKRDVHTMPTRDVKFGSLEGMVQGYVNGDECSLRVYSNTMVKRGQRIIGEIYEASARNAGRATYHVENLPEHMSPPHNNDDVLDLLSERKYITTLARRLVLLEFDVPHFWSCERASTLHLIQERMIASFNDFSTPYELRAMYPVCCHKAV